MRRIEYHKFERVIAKWQMCKIANYIWLYFDISMRVVFMEWDFAVVAKYYIWVLLIKPKHTTSAANIDNRLIHPLISASFCQSIAL